MITRRSHDFLSLLLLGWLFATAGVSCSGDGTGLTQSGDLPGGGFRQQIQPIFDDNCVRCHATGGVGYLQTGGDSDNGLDLTAGSSHSQLVDQATFEAAAIAPRWRVLPAAPDSSYLLQKLASDAPKVGSRMPADGPPFLAASEIELIRTWIVEGAQND